MFLARYNPPCFFDQCVGELILRNFTDHFALAEQQPLIFPSGNAQISFPRFTGPVDNTPHHRYRQRLGEILQPLLDLLSDFDQIDLAAATGGTADKNRPALTQFETFKNFKTDPYFLDRITSQRNAQSISNPIVEQYTQPMALLIVPLQAVPASVIPT